MELPRFPRVFCINPCSVLQTLQTSEGANPQPPAHGFAKCCRVVLVVLYLLVEHMAERWSQCLDPQSTHDTKSVNVVVGCHYFPISTLPKITITTVCHLHLIAAHWPTNSCPTTDPRVCWWEPTLNEKRERVRTAYEYRWVSDTWAALTYSLLQVCAYGLAALLNNLQRCSNAAVYKADVNKGVGG